MRQGEGGLMLMPDLDLGQDLGCGESRVHIHIHALGLSLVLRERSSSTSVMFSSSPLFDVLRLIISELDSAFILYSSRTFVSE